MRIIRFVRCVLGTGHRWVTSRSRPGYRTCTHCHLRRPFKTFTDASPPV